ncbi:MAG TPA: hypothetical protein VJ808_06845 [Gemmatimonadales bacterium]|nr:hypothetical protein [Gemmatimonadales bacterium]
MRTRISFIAAALAIVVACDRPQPTEPKEVAAPGLPGPSAEELQGTTQRGVTDRLARRLARALADAEFRAHVKGAMEASPFPENKLQFQRFLNRSNQRVLRQVARLTTEPEAAVQSDAVAAAPLEMYFPVPAHRAAWRGDANVLVASAREDGDAPVAYDVHGRRHVLSAHVPPATPVLAIVPTETDFGPEDSIAYAVNPTPSGPLPSPTPPPGLYMTYAHFVQDFEGWFKGSPEYEIHVLGQAGSSDSLSDYQCAGEPAGGYYRFDQNNLDWSGRVLLFTQTQLNSYKSAHPNQNLRIIALEDDDTGCQVKFDANRFKNLQTVLQASYPDLTGSKDTTGSLGKFVKRANALQKILRAAYSFITTQDDLIGNAVEDVVVGQFFPGANWIVKGENNMTNGWIKLEMR